MDVEWAGAIAKKPPSSSSPRNPAFGRRRPFRPVRRVNRVAPIVTLSYGLCDARPAGPATPSGTVCGRRPPRMEYRCWFPRATTGPPVVTTPPDTATHGRGVNALCSTPYSTCVGGTMFNDAYNPGLYWSATTAPRWVPCQLHSGAPLERKRSGERGDLGGRRRGQRRLHQACLASRARSSGRWQARCPRCFDGGSNSRRLRGSVSECALVCGGHFRGRSVPGQRDGAVGPECRDSAGEPQSCALFAGNRQLAAGGSAVFHDITSGNNGVPGVTGFNAGTGYDLATGLGSVDANLLVNHWTDASAVNSRWWRIPPASRSRKRSPAP